MELRRAARIISCRVVLANAVRLHARQPRHRDRSRLEPANQVAIHQGIPARIRPPDLEPAACNRIRSGINGDCRRSDVRNLSLRQSRQHESRPVLRQRARQFARSCGRSLNRDRFRCFFATARGCGNESLIAWPNIVRQKVRPRLIRARPRLLRFVLQDRQPRTRAIVRGSRRRRFDHHSITDLAIAHRRHRPPPHAILRHDALIRRRHIRRVERKV